MWPIVNAAEGEDKGGLGRLLALLVMHDIWNRTGDILRTEVLDRDEESVTSVKISLQHVGISDTHLLPARSHLYARDWPFPTVKKEGILVLCENVVGNGTWA